MARSLVGNYMTSLDMAGCSVTLLKLDDELVRLWDAPVNTAGAAVGGLRWRETVAPADSAAGCARSPRGDRARRAS